MDERRYHHETVSAKQYEDFDNCLREAAKDCAQRNRLELWQISAEWVDNEREGIKLTWTE